MAAFSVFSVPNRVCSHQLWTNCRQKSHVEAEQNRGAVGSNVCYTPVNGCLPTRVSLAARQVQFSLRPCRNASSELLGKRDDDALRAADVTEPVHVLVLGDFAYELRAMGAQAREDVLNVIDGEHDATYAQRVHWCVLRLSSDRRRRVELGQLKPTVAIRGPHHRDLASNVLEPNDKVHPTALDWHLALQLHTKLDKECLRSLKVFDHDENVVHSFKRHDPPSHF